MNSNTLEPILNRLKEIEQIIQELKQEHLYLSEIKEDLITKLSYLK